ncbi:hypothetical protein J2W30_004567 [Variovorax boronicumulans]|uniref:hypothetical protein n=1 Tax=Variovorax boronicumulans TaxID=436515 RepID=UPI0027877B02|nr:hypothetical protein [Variovorax boronicumulans]MDP9995665.1 hypothetical protein [Variovorax boronicumulans]MDQ0006870.1 hypothetical protein [Variovorax boronicumulans]MDQ0036792.1 hypothetical protein [Variovorax boronicumulans]MDQ0044531.1 hypothetical protein [Variovorax boronicumulans]
MNLSGKDNGNTGGTKRTGRQRASHRDLGAGSPHVFTTGGAMIRAAGGPGNACATCTFPKAAVPQIQAQAANALRDAKQICATPECVAQDHELVDGFMRPPRSRTPQGPASRAPR